MVSTSSITIILHKYTENIQLFVKICNIEEIIKIENVDEFKKIFLSVEKYSHEEPTFVSLRIVTLHKSRTFVTYFSKLNLNEH